jgi:hypothetical protein
MCHASPQHVSPTLSAPTYHRLLVLVLAAVLTTGRRTVTPLLHPVRYQAHGPETSSHRLLSQRRWSTWALARALRTCVLDRIVPPAPGLLAGDETGTEPPDPQVFGKGRHRDGVRSTSWRGKSTTTFAAMLLCVRRAIWQPWCVQTPTAAAPFSNLPRPLQETILYALAPAV